MASTLIFIAIIGSVITMSPEGLSYGDMDKKQFSLAYALDDNKNVKNEKKGTNVQETETKGFHDVVLQAVQLGSGQLGYKMVSHIVKYEDTQTTENLTSLYSQEPTIPGPSIFINTKDKLSLTLIDKDGKETNEKLNSLEAGTYPYYDNNAAETGLFGAIIVDEPGQTESIDVLIDGQIQKISKDELDKDIVLYMVGSTFWGMEIDKNGQQTALWTNPTIGADEGQKVRFHVLGLGSKGHDHTFHLHAHRWVDPGTTNIIDVKTISTVTESDTPITQSVKTSKTSQLLKSINAKIFGTDSKSDKKTITSHPAHRFVVVAGDGVGPGDWQYHCHVFAHMEAGMMGIFKVGQQGSNTQSIPGADPNTNFASFNITDEPGTWFKAANGGVPTVSESLAVIEAPGVAHFMMTKDSASVHTITSLIYPSGAKNMPFDEITGYRGGGIVNLDDPGLYVFTCKVHPYMFGAVIADNSTTTGLDLGQNLVVAGVTDENGIPTASDLALKLLRTFLIATNPDNWQNYNVDTNPTLSWNVNIPDITVNVGSPIGDIGLRDAYEAFGYDLSDKTLQTPFNPDVPGVGEVWINTQFEKTQGKTKYGSSAAINASTWEITKKFAFPQINENHPHNMWSSADQEKIYQTQWFDTRLTTFDRESGKVYADIPVGDAPSHVMTRPGLAPENPEFDIVNVAMNGEYFVTQVTPDGTKVVRNLAMQNPGQNPTHPHGHWITPDGSKLITPNAFTGDVTIYNMTGDSIQSRVSTGAIPIATSITPDGNKAYVANLLGNSISVVDMVNGNKIKDINLIENYNPITGEVTSKTVDTPDGPEERKLVGALPIQTPTSPDGRAVVTANTLTATITVVNATSDELVVMIPCDPGCHGVNFGAKQGGGYYAYVSSKFSNAAIVVDTDPNGDGDVSDAKQVGRILLVSNPNTKTDDTVTGLEGNGGQGVLAIPNVYNGWVQNLPEKWKSLLTEEQLNPGAQYQSVVEHQKNVRMHTINQNENQYEIEKQLIPKGTDIIFPMPY